MQPKPSGLVLSIISKGRPGKSPKAPMDEESTGGEADSGDDDMGASSAGAISAARDLMDAIKRSDPEAVSRALSAHMECCSSMDEE